MAQQTALDFFLMKLVDLEIGKTFYPNQHQDLQDAFKQAKAMEKEQMKSMYIEGWYAQMRYFDGKEIITAEQYYNETYNK